MMREITTQQAAFQVLQTIPPIMQVVAAEVRCVDHTIAPAHFRLLVMLSRCPSSLSELANWQGVSLPTISKSINVLVERGWVTHRPSPNDRRVVIAELTPLGQQVLADIYARTQVRLAEVLHSLSQQDLLTLVTALKVLEEALPATRSCST